MAWGLTTYTPCVMGEEQKFPMRTKCGGGWAYWNPSNNASSFSITWGMQAGSETMECGVLGDVWCVRCVLLVYESKAYIFCTILLKSRYIEISTRTHGDETKAPGDKSRTLQKGPSPRE